MITAEQKTKELRLRASVRAAGQALIAFSGGVDSTYLLKITHDELGADAVAVTSASCLVPASELADAREFCEQEGIELIVCNTAPLEIPGFAENSPERCYLCKTMLLTTFRELARERGIAHVFDGSNVDDLGDWRPGLRALREQKIESPLIECGFTKADIRACAHVAGLKVWDKPSAACLASRIKTGERITPERLARINAAEQYLHEQGLRQVRVRLLPGEVARIEVDEGGRALFAAASELREQAIARLLELGFATVEPEIALYRTGNMNASLSR